MVKKIKIADMQTWLDYAHGISPIINRRTKLQKSPKTSTVQANELNIVVPSNFTIKENLEVGNKGNIDKKTIQKIDSGKYPIDASLDLHGFNQEAAYLMFERLVLTSVQARHRLLLVIVGKGEVLRTKLPNWANAPAIRPFILRISIADAKHGGSGAFFVLLKRIRWGI